jgi:hypothetical protein
MPMYQLVALFAILVGVWLILSLLAGLERRIDKLQVDEGEHYESGCVHRDHIHGELTGYLMRIDNGSCCRLNDEQEEDA